MTSIWRTVCCSHVFNRDSVSIFSLLSTEAIAASADWLLSHFLLRIRGQFIHCDSIVVMGRKRLNICFCLVQNGQQNASITCVSPLRSCMCTGTMRTLWNPQLFQVFVRLKYRHCLMGLSWWQQQQQPVAFHPNFWQSTIWCHGCYCRMSRVGQYCITWVNKSFSGCH